MWGRKERRTEKGLLWEGRVDAGRRWVWNILSAYSVLGRRQVVTCAELSASCVFAASAVEAQKYPPRPG